MEQTTLDLAEAVNAFMVCDLNQNAYPERMISYYFIQAIVHCLEKPNVLLEVPIFNQDGNRRNNHIDAIIFDEQTSILCEFKRAENKEKWQGLVNDVKRVNSQAQDLLSRFQNNPNKIYGFYAADCWYKSIVDVWLDDKSYKNWHLPDIFKHMRRDSCTVWERKGRGYDGHYITWAIQEIM